MNLVISLADSALGSGRTRGTSEIEYAYSTALRFSERFSIWSLHFLNVFGRVMGTVWRAIAVV